MASAMRKMAVYLGLVEDDHRFDDQYQDEYGDDYDEYGAELVQDDDRQDVQVPEGPATAGSANGGRPARYRRPIWLGSRPCIRARTMRHVRSESTSVRALR